MQWILLAAVDLPPGTPLGKRLLMEVAVLAIYGLLLHVALYIAALFLPKQENATADTVNEPDTRIQA